MKILAVDLGNFNIKTSEGIIFQSRFRKITEEFEDTNVFEFKNKKYEMGIGEFDNTYNKAEKDYMPNLMYAIYKSIDEDKSSINLVLGVPASNLGIKESFKEELEGKIFKFSVDGNMKMVKINKVATVAEGLSSFYTLRKEQRDKDTLIIDVGGRTVNVCTFVNSKCIEKFTIPSGVINLYNKVAENYNANGNNATTEEIIRLVNNKTINCNKEKVEIVNNILNAIKLKINNIETYNIYLTGGGALELDTQFRNRINKYEILPNPIFSNVTGNKILAEIKWS